MDMGRVARGAAWAVVGGALLVVGAYLVLVAINWKDEVASPSALQLERIIRERPQVDDEANAYVYALGLGVREDQDPLAWGRTRKAFLENISPQQSDAGVAVFPGPDAATTTTRLPSSREFMKACRVGGPACLAHLQDSGEIDRLLASQAWLLDRYLAMIARSQWRETIPADVRAPFPPYHTALDGQQLLLAKAWRHARAGDADAAVELLQRDLAFWRTVIGSSDILITKMIAAAAIDRHFQTGNLILRELHQVGATAAAPASWRAPISREERSMRRVLAGEWHFARAGLDTSLQGANPDASAFSRITDRLIGPLLKEQATMNLFAGRATRLSDALDVELRRLPEAISDATMLGQEERRIHFYNPVGHIMYEVGEPSYRGYTERLADLEGTRRAALLATESRAGTQVGDMRKRLQDSPLKDPYTGSPFDWDEVSRSIVFTGLASRERGKSALLL